MASYSSEAQVGTSAIHCMVVTPDRAVLDQRVDFISIPLYDGEIGILPGHTPLVGRLGYGSLRIRTAGQVKRYFVDGGFVQVRDNVVTVLTQKAVAAAEIELEAAMNDLEKARGLTAKNELEMVEKSKAISRARALIRVAERQG